MKSVVAKGLIDTCLSETKRIWSALAMDGRLEKCDIEGASDYRFQCPCCDLVSHPGKGLSVGDCLKFCPLGDKWLSSYPHMVPCESPGSPYRQWQFELSKEYDCYDRAFMAGVIVELVDEAIAETKVKAKVDHIAQLKHELDIGIFNMIGELTSMKFDIMDELHTFKYITEISSGTVRFHPTHLYY